ncbi:hypothetical protein HDU78_007729 [Chytriomyces hyalinus]|nr:hypothetical protein HDU78_007729 [Chytriomyces hyalinus]
MQPDGITRSTSESDSDASSLHSNYSLNSDSDSLDAVLQLLLTTTYPNTDGFYSHDAEVLPDAMELLGPSLEHLNAIQIACILGDEDSALDILDFVSSSTEEIGARKVLCEFMGRVWGDGNTVLHLASFLGMSELVKRLLELGANPNKKNGRLYKPVDCADTDETRVVFSTVDEAPKSASPTFWTQDSESAKESNQLFHQPIPIMVDRCSTKAPPFDPPPPPNILISREARVSNQLAAFDMDLVLTQKSFSPSPIRHSKTKSMDGANAIQGSFSKGILSSKLPSSSSLASTCGSPSAGKRVRFSPETILLDVCQYGSDAQSSPLQTVKSYLYGETKHNSIPSQIQPSPLQNINSIQSPQQSLSLLHLASAYGHVEIARLLLQRPDVYVNARDREGWTPLHSACAEGHLAVIRLLLRSCGWIDEFGEKQDCDTEWQIGDDEDMFWPIDGPIDVDARNGDGDTPEMIAHEERRDLIKSCFEEEIEIKITGKSLEDGGVQVHDTGVPCGDNLIPTSEGSVRNEAAPVNLDDQSLELAPTEVIQGTSHSTQDTKAEQSDPPDEVPAIAMETPRPIDSAIVFQRDSSNSKLEAPSALQQSRPQLENDQEVPPQSPKPLRGTAARLIAAFNQKSESTSQFGSLGSLSSPLKGRRFGLSASTSSDTINQPTVNAPNPIRSSIGKSDTNCVASTASVAQGGRRRSLLNHRRDSITLSQSQHLSQTVLEKTNANIYSTNPGVVSSLGCLLPNGSNAAVPGSVTAKKEDAAKKKKAHRLSETTSGFFGWMNSGASMDKLAAQTSPSTNSSKQTLT